MAGRLDQVIVIDIEATCWDDAPPEGQEAEIIEIGVCAVDVPTSTRLSKRSILVKPEHSEVSPFCTELTTLTQAQVSGGVSFEHACQILRRRYRTSDRTWASYGDYDRRQFEKQCAVRNVPYPFSPTHINVKNLLAVFQGLRSEVGLVNALELMHLPLEGTLHRGADDAWNTALILLKLMLQQRGDLKPSQ
ncbi:MAG TPA: 3'-5' exonuclease [Aggregatilineaceae bacterium]|nr:3'-5' exonuclease [Aggregatilineaceae bacterium]